MDKSLSDIDNRLRKENGEGEMLRIFQTDLKKKNHTHNSPALSSKNHVLNGILINV